MDFAEKIKHNCSVLAVDIGGPIIRQKGKPTEGAAEAIRTVAMERFGTRVHLISQCDAETERRRVEVLEEQDFCARSLVQCANIHFCREICEKAKICAELGVTHFVENSIGAMVHIRSVPNLFLYHPDPQECERNPQFMQYVLDPTRHPESDAATRPITLVREWNAALIHSLLTTPIFRHLPRSVRPPAIIAS